ncbi:MAG: hypothetical protein ACC653_11170 [Gammaproteobacteria bacterium]
MATLKLENKIKALAQLALQFASSQPEKIAGIAPTDEDLTALYENQLDTTRRAQIFSHIANNINVHERWVRCVETLSYMDELESHVPLSETAENGNKLTDFLSKLFNTKLILGGGFSTAAVVVIMILILPQQADINIQLSFNGAYDKWGASLKQDWASLPDAKKPEPDYASDRSFFSEPKQKSQIQQVLETGFKLGVDEIGHTPFKDFGIVSTSLSNIPNSEVTAIMSAQQYDSLLQTGRLAAFAALQCRIDNSSERLEVFSTALSTLRQQLAELQFNDAKELMTLTATDTTSAVCQTAQYVVNLITN